MAISNFVQVPPQSTGLKIDTSEVTISVTGNTVERQNICHADPQNASNVAHVDPTYPDVNGPRYGSVVMLADDPLGNGPATQTVRLLESILRELQAINLSLASMVPSPVLSSELTSNSMTM